MTAPLIMAAMVAVTLLFAIGMSRRAPSGATDLALANRSIGAALLWILMGGEAYTSATFLGASGFIYRAGAPAFYVYAYSTVAFMFAFFLLPPLCERAREKSALNAADLFTKSFGSRFLGTVVAVVSVASALPYMAIQLGGMQLLIQLAASSYIDAKLSAVIAFALLLSFVSLTGIRGTAWASLFKDALVLAAVVFVGVWLPYTVFGSPRAVWETVAAQNPGFFTFDGRALGEDAMWFASTAALSALGAFMWPHTMAASFAASGPRALRLNSIFMPCYQLLLVAVYTGGLTALLVMPGLTGPVTDSAMMRLVKASFSPTVLGFVAGAGCLACLVPLGAQSLAAATVISTNLLPRARSESCAGPQPGVLRLGVALVGAAALGIWSIAGLPLVTLLILAYSGVSQLLPGAVLVAADIRASARTVLTGIVMGLVALCAATVDSRFLPGVNDGLLALVANALAVGIMHGWEMIGWRRLPNP